MDEIEQLVANDPGASAGLAIREMHYGRLDWLAQHIRICNFEIDKGVAKKLLSMLEGSEANCMFEMVAVRKKGLPPRAVDPTLAPIRNFQMAVEVARLGGFARSFRKRACGAVAEKYKLEESYVINVVRPYKEAALSVIEEEKLQAAYVRGEIDVLGRPKPTQTGFAEE